MNIFIYSDESGVLDKIHNHYFVFGGLIFLSREEKENWTRKYIHAEKVIRAAEQANEKMEIKASNISNKSKSKLYRSLNQTEKFGIVIRQKLLLDKLFEDKKGKQRYLDWAYKMAVKEKFLKMIAENKIDPHEVHELHFFVDEHATATNGLYELRESLEQEFKSGIYGANWSVYYPPIFPELRSVTVEFCNSSSKTLVRAADIVANHLYYLANHENGIIPTEEHLNVIYHP